MLLVAIVMLMQAAAPQNPPAAVPRDARSAVQAGNTGQIAGVLMSDEEQPKPIRHARVTCTSSDLPHGQTTVTDDRGRFLFSGLAPGRYTVTATKPAWVTVSYGAKRPGRPGTPVPVENGRRVDLSIRMIHGGVITGVVTDETGQPAAGVFVRAMRYVFSGGERRLQPIGSGGPAKADGSYRVYGLAPGDYVVGATDPSVSRPFMASELRLTSDLDVQHALQDPPGTPAPPMKAAASAATYFPGTTVMTQASVISLGPGEERGGVDFGLQLMSATTVEGTVTMPGGALPPMTQVTLLASAATAPGVGLPGAGFRIARPTGSDGRFSIGDVTPGEYTIVARANIPSPGGGPPSPLMASADVTVEGDPISGISLTLEPGMTLSGRVEFDGTALPPPNPKSVRVNIMPAQNQGPTITPSVTTVNPDGTFLMSGLSPGRYRLTGVVPGNSPSGGWSLRSATINGQDTLDVPLMIPPGANLTGAVITFTDHPAQLSGTLENSSGAAAPDYTIILFAANQSLWQPQSRRIQTTRPAADGVYKFRDVIPGEYLLAAVDDVEPGEWFDPSYLQSLVAGAMTVTVGEGEHKAQDVRLGGS